MQNEINLEGNACLEDHLFSHFFALLLFCCCCCYSLPRICLFTMWFSPAPERPLKGFISFNLWPLSLFFLHFFFQKIIIFFVLFCCVISDLLHNSKRGGSQKECNCTRNKNFPALGPPPPSFFFLSFFSFLALFCSFIPSLLVPSHF